MTVRAAATAKPAARGFRLGSSLSPSVMVMLGAASPLAWSQTTDSLLKSQQAVLNIVWEVASTPRDRMSTVDLAEARRFPMLGPTYYIASRQAPGTQPLYRLRADNGDHRADLRVPQGYALQGTLGYLWTAKDRPPGSGPVWSVVNSKTGDQGLSPPGAAPKDYTAAPISDAYGWARYGKDLPLLKLDGKQVSISSNLAAGGALWSLEWKGQQFIDQLDYGRLVQSSLSFSGPGASKALPTEGGDQTADPDPSFMHGSPVLSSGNTITPKGRTQSTRALPLEWLHTAYNGGDAGKVVAYPGWQLGKDITLDDSEVDLAPDRPQWSGQVMRYATTFVNGGPPLPQADIEIPTAYLKANYRRSFTCNATEQGAGALREVFGAQFQQLDIGTWQHQFTADAGGVILANDSLTHALGIYGSAPQQGGSARYFTLWRFGPSVSKPAVNKSSAGAGPTTLVSGSNRFQSWLVVGQTSEVCAIMRQLYARGLR